MGEKTRNVGRGINIAIVNCELLNVFFQTSLKVPRLDFQRYLGRLMIFANDLV